MMILTTAMYSIVTHEVGNFELEQKGKNMVKIIRPVKWYWKAGRLTNGNKSLSITEAFYLQRSELVIRMACNEVLKPPTKYVEKQNAKILSELG